VWAQAIINLPGSEGQKFHKDVDTEDSVVVFMVPLVDVTNSMGCTEVIDETGKSVLAVSKAGVPYMFNGHAKHRATPNTSTKYRPVIVLDLCAKASCDTLYQSELYKK
jgi:hypothetical protein